MTRSSAARDEHHPVALAAEWFARLRSSRPEAWQWPAPDFTGRSSIRLQHGAADVWIVRWPPGTRAPMHDHGGAAGAFVVLCGRLTERVPMLAGPSCERSVGPARVLALAPDIVHALENHADKTVYSVHAYVPGLTSMTFYERQPGGTWSPARRESPEDWQ